jgi:hypothetical protein
MEYGYEIQRLRVEVDSLREAFLQSQINFATAIDKADSTANAVEQITPTTYTKTAYIGDTEVSFVDVPSGNLTVYTDNPIAYTMAKDNNRVIVSFEPLTEVTTITISIV